MSVNWDEIVEDYSLEFRAVSETEYCVQCETYMDKFRTKANADVPKKGVFYRCPKCGYVVQAMRPLHVPVKNKAI